MTESHGGLGPRVVTPRRDGPTVCIIGSGVAGALTAWKLGRAGVRTLVLEAGPRYPQGEAAQRMERFLEGDDPWSDNWPDRDVFSSVGEVDYPLNDHRVQGVGGTTLHWQAYSYRFLENDFRMRSRYGVAEDWPISYDDLEPYYGEAEVELGVACEEDNPFAAPRTQGFPLPGFPWAYDERFAAAAAQRLGITFHSIPQARTSEAYQGRPACQTYGVCRVCPIRARYGAEIHVELAEATGEVTVVPNARVVRLETGGSGRVARAVYKTRDGTEHGVAAEAFVLAAHAVESPRLLLLSAQSGHPDGLANSSGAVGRYFMEHMGQFRLATLDRPLYPLRNGFQTTVSQQFHDREDRDQASGFLFRGTAGAGPSPESFIAEVALRSGNWGEAFAQEGLERIEEEHGRTMLIGSNAEALPSEDNWVDLDPELTDAFGDPAPRLSYSISEYERRGYEDGDQWIHEMADVLGARSLGPIQNHFGSHQAGTCRMGHDPASSVVDQNLRAHDVENLFVVGSSNFVTTLGGEPHPDHRGAGAAAGRSPRPAIGLTYRFFVCTVDDGTPIVTDSHISGPEPGSPLSRSRLA